MLWISMICAVFALLAASFSLGFAWSNRAHLAQCRAWEAQFKAQEDRFVSLENTYRFLGGSYETEKLFREFDKDYQNWLTKELARTERKYFRLWKKQVRRSASHFLFTVSPEVRATQPCVALLTDRNRQAEDSKLWRHHVVRKLRKCPPIPLP